MVLLAAILSLFALIGHFVAGTKLYLKPVLKSNLDEVPTQVMRSLFHYMSAFMLISTFVLFEAALSLGTIFESVVVVLYTGLIYLGLAMAQLIVIFTSGIKGGLLKLFQWVFWVLISVCCLVGYFN